MRRETRFLISCRPFAIDLSTVTAEQTQRGDCHGRWDGDRYWGAQEPEVMEHHLALLGPMLADYPTIPAGYDGWWTYAA